MVDGFISQIERTPVHGDHPARAQIVKRLKPSAGFM